MSSPIRSEPTKSNLAAVSPIKPAAVGFDDALSYLADVFDDLAFQVTVNFHSGVPATTELQRMGSIATAMSLLPAAELRGIEFKTRVSQWSFEESEGRRVKLSSEAIGDLMEAAHRDARRLARRHNL